MSGVLVTDGVHPSANESNTHLPTIGQIVDLLDQYGALDQGQSPWPEVGPDQATTDVLAQPRETEICFRWFRERQAAIAGDRRFICHLSAESRCPNTYS